MSLETNSANEIRAKWLELEFKLIIIDFTDFVNWAMIPEPMCHPVNDKLYRHI